MRLRHVLLLACAVGASGALLLAWDMHRRLKDAESTLLLSGAGVSPVPASQPRADGAAGRAAGSPNLAPEESTLSMLAVHSLGLLSLAFLFLAVFLLLISALREKAFASVLGGEPIEKPTGPASPCPLPIVMPLSEAAQKDATPSVNELPGPPDAAAQSQAEAPPGDGSLNLAPQTEPAPLRSRPSEER